ncbi:hypothetical protein ACHHYP_14132 [Achlya hypogyna]|uniref:Uncharacterized protein n=1 Tax=Achlya hypogyna TaxID=1202772 RepID=A0A1V9YDU8_ACHHY|nr:hypothetical protein ACHHYP_14132 [Achlya hypogyna]
MSKRKLPPTSAAAKKGKPAPATRPITAFFQRASVQPTTAVPAVEDIDSVSSQDRCPDMVISSAEDKSDDAKLVQSDLASGFEKQQSEAPKKPRRRHPPSAFTMLVRREHRGCMQRQELQRMLRSRLVTYAPLPLGLTPDVRANQWISTMAFDADGVILAAGSSSGTIALYDFDEYFYHLQQHRNASAKSVADVEDVAEGAKTYIPPVHVIPTSLELKRLRWNPWNQDEIACSFASRNEIFLFNLKKLPRQPYRVLRATSRPSSGYYDLLYVSKGKQVAIIAADTDGAIRQWDIHVPLKPQWQVSLPREYGAVNALALCGDQRHLVAGTEHGWIVVYDTATIIVPAFAQKPVPKRVAAIAVHALVRGLFVHDVHPGTAALGVVSMQLSPQTNSAMLCQLHNDWIVVVDVLEGRVRKVHTVLRQHQSVLSSGDATVVSAGADLFSSENRVVGTSVRWGDRFESSYLRLHHCEGNFVFNGAAFVTGLSNDDNLYVLDMHTHSYGERTLPSVQTLQRFRIPTQLMVTAVAAHPASNVVVCGTENNELLVIGAT